MNRKAWILAPLALVLGGCAASNEGPSVGNIGRGFADDFAGARGYDRATLALSRGDLARVQQVGRALDKRIESGSPGALSVASTWMTARSKEAERLDVGASQTPFGPDRERARVESNRLYRAALAFLPSDTRARRSLDPSTLNSLGYFLAERGRTPAQWQQAVELTALAVELSPATNSVERRERALFAQDSHAWALFKTGQTAKALETQIAVLSTASEGTAKYGPPPAEVVYHLGAILRVAGHEQQARAAFRVALGLGPSVELEEILRLGLEGQLT